MLDVVEQCRIVDGNLAYNEFLRALKIASWAMWFKTGAQIKNVV
jgi:hypothetical protein